MLAVPGYRIDRKIYESVCSLIFRGVRVSDKSPVILKLLKEAHPSPRDLNRYRREFDITGKLKVEGVARAYDLIKHGNSLVMVLEDFGAESLRDWIGHHETCMVELLELMVRVTRILGDIHEQDIIHKDINPSNIAYNSRTGQLSIIDFGIATKLPKESPILTAPNVLEGTLCYMSPEQTGRMNRFLDYRTDYYSLGVTFYELLCKRLPFQAEDAMALVHAHLAREPEPPCEVNPSIPRSLSRIIMKLLEKTADARYRSSWGIEADLRRCLDALKVNRSAPLFTLGEKDFSDRFHIPQKLYGREREVERLTAAFERVRRGRTETMMVSGYAGIGKSYLVRELYRSITDSRGHFVSGKYDQFHRIPYSAISEAFRELILQIVAEGQEAQEKWRKRILKAVGNNGQVIVELVHELELIIGEQPPVPYLGGVEAANRFRHVFYNFLKTFCLPSHPLVLFVDDLQWADTMSLELLRQLVCDEELSYLFLIGSYRDHELDATHPLLSMIRELKKSSAILEELKVERMSLHHVTAMIADTLQTDKKRVKPLAKMVFRKTAGNPFFIGQFMETLYQEGLLSFTPPDKDSRPGWVWDLEAIEAVGFTDNVVDLVIGKLNKLPGPTREAVKMAACVGNRFDLETLAVIQEKNIWEAHDDLLPAVREGFVLPDAELEAASGKNQPNVCHFRFLHDRVQQAAYGLIDPSMKEQVHLNIGQLLMAKISGEERGERLFELVDHFNAGRKLIVDERQKADLAAMNLAAGKKAREAAAYVVSCEYLMIGMELLALWMNAPPDKVFGQYPDMVLSFFRCRAEVEYLNGRFEQAEAFQRQAIRLGRSSVEKAEIYHLLIVQHTVQAKYEEALAVGREALKLLGIHLCEDRLEEAVFSGVMEVKQQLGDTSIPTLIHRPLMTDPEKKASMLLLSTLFPTCYILNQNVFALLIVTAANLSLRYGHVPSSAMSYSVLGTLFGPLLGDYPTGYAFASLGMNLADKLDDPIQKCQTRHVMIAFNSHWTRPLGESLPIADDGLQAGRECGDLQFASYILFFKSLNLFVGGKNLETLFEDLAGFRSFCERTRNRIAIDMVIGCQMVLANLLGKTSSYGDFSLDELSEAQFLAGCKKLLSRQPLCSYYVLKAQVCFLYGDHEEALAYIRKAGVLLPCVLGFISVAEHNFYHSLILLSLMKTMSPSQRRRALRQVSDNQKQMAIWSGQCPENFKHKYVLVEAERARCGNRFNQAMDLYDEALDIAGKQDFIQDQALIAELAGRFWMDRGKVKIGVAYLRDAHHGYQLWGAGAKTFQLISQFPQWLTQARRRSSDHRHTDLSRTTISGETSSRALDLATVLKASRAISGEIVLEELLTKLMAILIENAGAQKGLLLLEKGGEWIICARGSLEDEETLLEREPLSKTRDLSPAMVHFVIKTGEAVLLENAAEKGRFMQDPYVKRNKSKSVLCMPILNQGRLTGVLYLENNLAPCAFTQDLLELLQLLSAQAAVSIVNAGLYANLEKKVRERTRELQAALQQLEMQHSQLKKTKDQLVESEKMAALGTLTAGVAHEIRNPLNFINNFAAISLELFIELKAMMSELGGQPDAECFDLLEDLRLNVGSIHKHGLTADQIVKSMMELADEKASEVRKVDLNQFVDEYVELACMGKRGPDGSLGITLNKKYDPDTGFLQVAPKSLSRVWIHLVNNAIEALQEKALSAGSSYHGEIQVHTRNRGDRIEVLIRDNGVGIKKEEMENIFHPFFTTKPPGTGHIGLGLARCYDILTREHGGRIEIESQEDLYTQVIAVIPKVRGP